MDRKWFMIKLRWLRGKILKVHTGGRDLDNADKPFRWGILGIGNIASSFAKGIQAAPGAQLVAAASTSEERARAFQKEFHVPRAYASYAELIQDPQVDAIYIATRHPQHYQNALDCLRAGKPILVEKPFTLNAVQARHIAEEARQQSVFCMEAMWTRFLPSMDYVRQVLANGDIGEPQLLHADFCFQSKFDAQSRLYDPHKGGGSLLDVGVYPISLAHMTFGPPVEVTGVAAIGATGVDEQATIALRHAKGQCSSLMCGVRAASQFEAHITGTKGRLRILKPWAFSTSVELHLSGKDPQIRELPFLGNGYAHEALEVMNCVRSGKLESPLMTLADTVSIMETMDTLRKLWHIAYPGEE